MKRLFLTISIVLVMTTSCLAAEFLIQAKPHWMDSLTQAEVDKLKPQDLVSYKARAQIGDIIIIKADGWPWGKEEALPNYIVVKVSGMNTEEAQKYEESLMDRTNPDNPIMLRLRKHSLSKAQVEIAKTGQLNSISIGKTAALSYISEKTGKSGEIVSPKTDLVSYLEYLWDGPKRDVPDRMYPGIFVRMARDRIINPAYAASQLLKTVKPSGGDYTTLEGCVHANEQNLVTADKYFDVEIDGTWSGVDNTMSTIHNYTADATHYINIYTTAASRHPGYYSNSSPYYRKIGNAGGNGYQVLINNSYVTLTGFIAYNSFTTAGADRGIMIQDARTYVVLNKMIVYAYGYAFRNYNYSATGIAIRNSVILSTNSNATYNGLAGKIIAQNSVAISRVAGVGFHNFTCTNCYAATNAGTDYSSCTVNTSASHDATGTAGLQNVAYATTSGAYFTNVTAGSEDFHITNASSALCQTGTDLSATFIDDIDGNTRYAWDVGVDYIIVVAGDTFYGSTLYGATLY